VAERHGRRAAGAPKALAVALSFCRLLGLGCPKQAFAKIATPRALVQRGSLTLWFEESALSQWYVNERKRKRGAPTRYSDWLIQMALMIREVFHLPLRSLEGFLRSIVQMLNLEGYSVPDYTTLCRRQKRLTVKIPRLPRGKPVHIAVDSSGSKVYGEGEWKRRVHGAERRRVWRKLHIGVDCESRRVIACELTASFVTDAQVLADLLEQVTDDPIASVSSRWCL